MVVVGQMLPTWRLRHSVGVTKWKKLTFFQLFIKATLLTCLYFFWNGFCSNPLRRACTVNEIGFLSVNYPLKNKQQGKIQSIFANDVTAKQTWFSNFLLPRLKPGLHESQLPVEWSVTLLYSIVVERCCWLQRAAASLDYNRRNQSDAPLNLQLRFV